MKKNIVIYLFIILVAVLTLFYFLGSHEPAPELRFMIGGESVRPGDNVIPFKKYIDSAEEIFVAAIDVVSAEGTKQTYLNFGRQADESIISEIELGKNVYISNVYSENEVFFVTYSVNGGEEQVQTFDMSGV